VVSETIPTVTFTQSNPPQPVTRIDHSPRRRGHERNTSTNTVVYDPKLPTSGSPSSNLVQSRPFTAKNSSVPSGAITPVSQSGRKTPRRQMFERARPRPMMMSRAAFQSTPNIHGLLHLDALDRERRRPSLALDLASDLGDNKAAGGGLVGAMPASLATQMDFSNRMRQLQRERGEEEDREAQQRMSRLMLARMNNLEEGFREVLKEVKDWSRAGSGNTSEVGRGKAKTRRVEELRGKKRDDGNKDVEGEENMDRRGSELFKSASSL